MSSLFSTVCKQAYDFPGFTYFGYEGISSTNYLPEIAVYPHRQSQAQSYLKIFLTTYIAGFILS